VCSIVWIRIWRALVVVVLNLTLANSDLVIGRGHKTEGTESTDKWEWGNPPAHRIAPIYLECSPEIQGTIVDCLLGFVLQLTRTKCCHCWKLTSREVFSQCNLGVSGKLVALCKGIQSSWLSKKSTFSVKGQFNYIGKILKENYWGKIQLKTSF